MKRMKKIFAMLLAFTMILGMTMTASAEETGKITITGKGITDLSIVQVVKAAPTTRTGWTFTEGMATAYINAFELEGDDLEQRAIDQLIALAEGDDDGVVDASSLKTALNTVANNADFNSFTNGSVAPNGAGIYAVKAVGGAYTYNMMAAYVGFGTTEAGVYPVLKNVTLEAKRQPVTTVKNTTDTDKVTNIGDVVTFVVTTNVPAIETGAEKDLTYYFYDEITGADFYFEGTEPAAVKTVELGEEDITEVHPFVVDLENEHKFSINLSDLLFVDNRNAGLTVTVTYTAKVKDVTVDNKAWAGHKFDTYDDATYGQDDEKLTTGEIILTKKDEETKTPLAGAKFKVYKEVDGVKTYAKFDTENGNKFTEWATSADDAVVVTTGANGTVTVQGLDSAYTYKFEEVEAPAGYSKNELDSTATWGDIPTDLTKTVKGTAVMEDTKLIALPSTGGIGTTIFTVAGCGIMIAAAFFFFANRKKENE